MEEHKVECYVFVLICTTISYSIIACTYLCLIFTLILYV